MTDRPYYVLARSRPAGRYKASPWSPIATYADVAGAIAHTVRVESRDLNIDTSVVHRDALTKDKLVEYEQLLRDRGSPHVR